MSEVDAVHSGGCLCGKVRFELRGALRPVMACHCGQCRRTHGHVGAYTALPKERLTLTEQLGLAWYRSSEGARRGFCRDCGASLFFDPIASKRIGVAAGSLDDTADLRLAVHIYVAHKGDYYEITDDLPRHDEGIGSASGAPPTKP